MLFGQKACNEFIDRLWLFLMKKMARGRDNMFFKVTKKCRLHSFSCFDSYASVIGAMQMYCWNRNGVAQAFSYIGEIRMLERRVGP